MASFYTNLSRVDLDTFTNFLKYEGLKPSAALLRIFREWCRFIAGAPALPRYSTISPEQLNLILGEVAQIKRGLNRCELALLDPRPLSPPDLAEWKMQQEAVRHTLQRIDEWQDGLIRTGKVIATPPLDLENARRLALYSYGWKSPRVDAYQKLLWGLLSLFIKIPERPVPSSVQPTKPLEAPTEKAIEP